MNRELITKQDYQILGIKENSTPNEINLAYEKLCSDYHPEKIKLKKLREPNDLEIKKYKEIEKVYKKFDLEPKKYICWGWKNGEHCWNEFYPCLWEKMEDGYRKLFCSQECYNSKFEGQGYEKEAEWKRQKFENAKKNLAAAKIRKLRYIKEELERVKVKPEQLEPNNRNFEEEINNVIVQNADDDEATIRLYDISDRIEKDIYSKVKKEKKFCDNCHQEIKERREGNKIWCGVGGVDNEGNYYTFCSEECSDKGMRGKGKFVVKKNAFAELLKWMEKEGITNISLDPNSGKLVVEYGKNNSQTIEDDKLTSEQAEIKAFFQQNSTGNQSLSQSELKAQIASLEGTKPKDKSWVMPLTIIGLGAVILVLIGVIIQKSRKKGY